MAKIHVSTTINGAATEFLCDANQTLLDVLRDSLGLTGSKEGCGSGDCGACSILVDGTLVCSCLMLGVEAEGKAITTIEGIADGDKLHPVQQKFLEHAALQCGFCTPGLIVAAKALLDQNPNPSVAEIRDGLAAVGTVAQGLQGGASGAGDLGCGHVVWPERDARVADDTGINKKGGMVVRSDQVAQVGGLGALGVQRRDDRNRPVRPVVRHGRASLPV